jgi:H+/Cl- antiporter ClcA
MAKILVWFLLIYINLQHGPMLVSSFIPLQQRPSSTRRKNIVFMTKDKGDKQEKDWNTSLFPVKPFSPPAGSSIQQLPPPEEIDFIPLAYLQLLAVLTGIGSGIAVAGFKLSIDGIRQFCYGEFASYIPGTLIPALGGVAVAILAASGDFSPGLRGAVKEVDGDSLTFTTIGMESASASESPLGPFRSIRKIIAAIFTLGTGNSLGPEGPGVEIGVAISRLFMLVWPPDVFSSNEGVQEQGAEIVERVRRNRLLLSCGAAAGVASGFNAPLSGVFFALEVVQAALPTLSIPSSPEGVNINGLEDDEFCTLPTELQQRSLFAGSIACILTSSVLGALVSRLLLGNELALELVTYEIKTPLLELPLYLLLGASCGLVSVVFSQIAKLAKAFSDGNVGPLWAKDSILALPTYSQPILGGLFTGIVGLFYPQIFFFGYETLNSLLEADDFSTELLLTLLVAKILTTAVSAGSGLVGGLLAPSLFMAGMVGASFHNIAQGTVLTLELIDPESLAFAGGFELAGVPAYAMVGAACVLAATFRAPLTASLLLFEITRNYDVLLPLLASAGVASLVCDIVGSKVEARKFY